MDLPKALAAQSETFQAMTSMLKQMKDAADESPPQHEESVGQEESSSPADDLLMAARNYVEDSTSHDQSQTELDDISDAVREILAQTAPQTEYGDKLQEVVATSFSKITNPASMTLADELKARYKVPSNCKELAVPKVNTEVWTGLPQLVKAKDARSQHLQQHLSRALVAQAKATEQLLTLISKTKNSELQGILKVQMDSAMAVGLAMKEINLQRKQTLKPSLLQEYAGLASASLPVTEYLFGDNLEASMKLVKSTSKIVRSVLPSTRAHPYGGRPNKNYGAGFTGNLNFRRQSYGPPRTAGNQRPMQWRQTYASQNKGKRFPGPQRQ